MRSVDLLAICSPLAADSILKPPIINFLGLSEDLSEICRTTMLIHRKGTGRNHCFSRQTLFRMADARNKPPLKYGHAAMRPRGRKTTGHAQAGKPRTPTESHQGIVKEKNWFPLFDLLQVPW